MDKLIMEDIQLYGYHGVLPEENRLGQKFIVSIEAELDLRPAGSMDNLDETINYVEIYEEIKNVVQLTPYRLIEAVAEAIAKNLLITYPEIKQIKVRVKKPNPPFEIYFSGVTVEITRWR
jgi:dihydroneopterin aldolase